MLVELGLVQRYQAVLEVLNGVPVMEVARRNGVARQTVHDWLRRYGREGLQGLMDPELEAEDKRRSDYRRWERRKAMELWQMDVMGGVRLSDGSELKVVTGIDDHSQFCVGCAVPQDGANRVLGGPDLRSLEEARSALDLWVEHYNRERPLQGIGMIPPIRRCELQVSEVAAIYNHNVRLASATGLLPNPEYHELEVETLEVAVSAEGLIEVTHREVLVATHVRRHPVERELSVWRREPRTSPTRPQTVGRPVIRKVDSSGNVSFAAAAYRVGNQYRRQAGVSEQAE